MFILKQPAHRIVRCAVIGFLIVLAAPSAACRKKVPAGARPAGLELARSAFAAGDCAETAASMEDFVAREGIESATPEGLFSLALCYLSGPEALRDRDRALDLLRHVQDEGTDAGSRRQAALVLELLTQARAVESSLERRSRRVRELEEEIEGLKQIDTRPQRPPR